MSASPTVPQAGTTVSPKVTWPLVAGLLLTIAAAAVNGILTVVTPDALAPVLGPLWAVPVATVVTTGLQALVGYLKRDPLRDMTPQLHPQTVVRAVESPQGVATDTADVPATAVDDDGYDAVNPLGLPADEHPQP